MAGSGLGPEGGARKFELFWSAVNAPADESEASIMLQDMLQDHKDAPEAAQWILHTAKWHVGLRVADSTLVTRAHVYTDAHLTPGNAVEVTRAFRSDRAVDSREKQEEWRVYSHFFQRFPVGIAEFGGVSLGPIVRSLAPAAGFAHMFAEGGKEATRSFLSGFLEQTNPGARRDQKKGAEEVLRSSYEEEY